MSDFINAYISMLKNYVNFSGTTNMKDFLYAIIPCIVIEFVLGILGVIPVLGFIFYIILGLFNLAHIVPLIAILVRRLRDAKIIK